MHLMASLIILFLTLLPAARAEFLIRDGDKVAFLGDSITAARGYTKIIEHYTLVRFPDRNVEFINAGKGGDTASGCLVRLDRDVFSKGATLVTVALGVNDIGWGMKADAEHRQKYLDGIKKIVEACQSRKVRVIICSPAITAENPVTAENGFLQKMTDDGMNLARSMGAETIDIQRGMREIQKRILEGNSKQPDKKKQVQLHVADGVHLSDLGQLAMAYSILKGLGAPEVVSKASLDAATGKILDQEQTSITQVKVAAGKIEFIRHDRGLPLNLGTFSTLNYRWVPIPDGLNQYMLKVSNLPAGRYEIKVDGRVVGKVQETELARGVNISSMTADPWEPGGPWDAQSSLVKELVDARDKVWMSDVINTQFLKSGTKGFKELEKKSRHLDEEIVELQRAAAEPRPYHFVLEKLP